MAIISRRYETLLKIAMAARSWLKLTIIVIAGGVGRLGVAGGVARFGMRSVPGRFWAGDAGGAGALLARVAGGAFWAQGRQQEPGFPGATIGVILR